MSARDGALLTLVRGGLRVVAAAADCEPAAAELVSVPRPRDSRAALPGFVLIHGDTPLGPTEPEVRVYFHVTVAGAPTLVATLTAHLNAIGLPFDLKLVAAPADYRRADAAVLYLEPGGFAHAREAIGACADLTRAGVPAFTKPLARGIAVGEHVRDHGSSFGTSRCRLVAEAFLAAREVDERIAAAEREFAALGLSLDHPYLAPGSHDGYE